MPPKSFDELAVGHQFPSTSYQLTESVVSSYVGAVGGQQEFLTSGTVPPLAIAAFAMTALAKSFAVPPGSIHASQELEFLKKVPIGATVRCGGRIAQKIERGRLTLVILEIDAVNQDQEKVMAGKATIAIPQM